MHVLSPCYVMVTLASFLVTGALPATDVFGKVKTEPCPEDPEDQQVQKLPGETLVKVKIEPAGPGTSHPSSLETGTSLLSPSVIVRWFSLGWLADYGLRLVPPPPVPARVKLRRHYWQNTIDSGRFSLDSDLRNHPLAFVAKLYHNQERYVAGMAIPPPPAWCVLGSWNRRSGRELSFPNHYAELKVSFPIVRLDMLFENICFYRPGFQEGVVLTQY